MPGKMLLQQQAKIKVRPQQIRQQSKQIAKTEIRQI